MSGYTNEQTQMYRQLVGHYSQQLGVSVGDIAESAGISKQRLAEFSNYTLPELSSSEFQRLQDLMQPLANGEAQDISEFHDRGMDYPGRSYQDVIAEVVQLQGGEKE